MSDTYDLGDPVLLALDVTVNGVAVQPTTITLTVLLPDGTTATLAPTATAVGHYEVTYTPAIAGTFQARWVTTGAAAGSETYTFVVLPAFAGRYCTVADVRAAGAPVTLSDAQINGAIESARERIDRYCSDTFLPTTMTVRAVMTDGSAPLPLRVQSVSSVTYADAVGGGSVVPATSYSVRSSAVAGDSDVVQLLGYGLLNAALLDITYEPVRSGSYGTGERAVLVTGVFGWTVVPDAVHDAAVQLALADLPGTSGSVNMEGDADLGTPPTVPQTRRATSSTGSAWADALLMPYVRERLRIS